MTMDKLELQKLRELPVEGVAERLGLQVTRHKALCPFHDDHHASLSFSVRRNTFRCFVCNASGGTIDLVMRYLNLGFKEACRWLADGVLTPPPCGHPLSEGETYRTLPVGQKTASLCASPSERGAGGSYSALSTQHSAFRI